MTTFIFLLTQIESSFEIKISHLIIVKLDSEFMQQFNATNLQRQEK